MRFLLDVGISPQVRDHLQRNGHDALRLLDLGYERWSDERIAAYAAAEQRMILTTDTDFGAIAVGRKDVGVILFRGRSQRPELMIEMLDALWLSQPTGVDPGAIVVIDNAGIRVRQRPEV